MSSEEFDEVESVDVVACAVTLHFDVGFQGSQVFQVPFLVPGSAALKSEDLVNEVPVRMNDSREMSR